MRVGIFAGSSCVPQVEFAAGLEHLRSNGFEPVIHPQVWEQRFIFPGSDEDRAGAIYDFAINDSVPILWAARGGYGAGRLLPILEQLTKKNGKPKQKKLLIGYSDVTVLHEFVRSRWGWSTLHAPMPAASNFGRYDAKEFGSLLDYVNRRPAASPWENAKLTWMVNPPTKDLRGELVGGNLSLWAALVGTPWFGSPKNKMIFLEDIDEPFYRIDRMMVQIEQAGGFDGAAAVVLGDFTNCKDENNTCLSRAGSDERKPLRKVFELDQAMEDIFVPIGKRTGMPFAKGLPVGHGPNFAPLPLGATYDLSATGRLKLLEWDWLSRAEDFVA